MNNKGFILYDGLLSFLILSSFICFFVLVININQKQSHFNSNKLDALNDLRDSAYTYYETGTFLNYDTDNIYSTYDSNNYCIYYKVGDGYEKVCII